MNISGFTYVRNGFTYGYPFVASIRSLLPLVDELIVVVGDSNDGTREAIEQIGDARIEIVDSIWNLEMRQNGKIFAEQSNIGLRRIRGKWGIHLQVDEVLDESAPDRLRVYMEQADKRDDIEGLILPFLHFWGDFKHIRHTRRTHAYEIRAFKNNGLVRSYKDSQGFRRYNSEADYISGAMGHKLRVLQTDVPIFHYSYSRHPSLMKKKDNFFNRFWHNDEWIATHSSSSDFDFNEVDRLQRYEGQHPALMQDIIAQQNWTFNYDPSRSNMRLKDRFLNAFERKTGIRPFAYKNYRVVR